MVATTSCIVNISRCVLLGNKTSYLLSFSLIKPKLYPFTYLLCLHLHAINKRKILNSIMELLVFCSCLDIWFYVKDADLLHLIGYWILYWSAYPLCLFGCLFKCQIVIKKSC